MKVDQREQIGGEMTRNENKFNHKKELKKASAFKSMWSNNPHLSTDVHSNDPESSKQ